MSLKRLALVALLSLTPGCEGRPCEASAGRSLEIGEGLDDFAPLDSPASMDLVYGPQGGVHVEVALLSTGLDASGAWRVEVEGYQGGEQVAATAQTLPEPTCRPDGAGAQVAGLRLIFGDQVSPSDLEAPIEIVARVTDSLDNVAEDIAEDVTVVVP